MRKYFFFIAFGFYGFVSSAQNVGIGITTPQSKFHVAGTAWFNGDNTPLPAAAGKGVAIGQAGDNGYLFSFDYSTFSPTNLLLQSPGGNVGIGTTSPLTKLTVNSDGFGIEHTNGTVRLGTFVNATAGWLGTISNHPLHFYTNNSNPQLTLSQAGFLGIGTTNPLVKLHVNGPGVVESSVQSTSERSILSLNSTISGQNRVWTLENGLFGTAGLFGIYDRTASQARLTIQPQGPVNIQGNTTQDLGGFGLPKAMVAVNGDGTLLRCYNGVSGSSSSGCGFTASRFAGLPGRYEVDFGFDILNRFYSVSVQSQFGEIINFDLLVPTKMFVTITESDGTATDRPFIIIIY